MSKTINNLSKDLKDLVNHFDLVDYEGSANSVDEIFNEGLRQVQDEVNQVRSDLDKTENDKYSTINGKRDFSCDKDGYIDNIYIEGKTMVNLCYGFVDNPEPTTYNNYRRLKNYITGYDTYTVMVPYIKPGGEKTYIGFEVYDENGQTTNYSFAVISPEPKVVNIPSNYKIATIYGPNAHYTHNEILNICQTSFIIPGNHIDDMPLHYFKGVKSLGKDFCIDFINYDCTEDVTEELIGDVNWIHGAYIECHEYSPNYGSIVNIPNISYHQEYIPVESNTIYLFDNINHNISYYDGNKNIIRKKHVEQYYGLTTYPDNYSNGLFYFNTKDTVAYIRLTAITNKIDKIKIYKNSKYSRERVFETLRSLPNGVCDTIEKRGDRYVKVQRCGEFLLTGDVIKDAILDNTANQKVLMASLFILNNTNIGGTYGYSDNFRYDCVWSADGKERIYIDVSNANNTIGLMINKSKLSSISLSGLKTYFNQNPTTLVYELDVPQIIELPNINPQTFEGNNRLVVSTGNVQGNCSFEVSNSIGGEIKILRDKINRLESVDYVKDIKDQITFFNGCSHFGGQRFYAHIVDNVVKICMLLTVPNEYKGAYNTVFKVSEKYKPLSKEFIVCASNTQKTYVGCLDEFGYFIFEHTIDANDVWVCINLTYPIRG